MIFFKNVPHYGDLKIAKVLFLFDNMPMVFVCNDDKKRYFLCQCVDVINGFSWMITLISKKLLISMMRDEISILSAFKDSGNDIILADEVENKMVYKKIPFEKIPSDELPEPDEKLENPDLREYIEQLQREEIIYKSEKKQDFKIVWKCSGNNIAGKIKKETIWKPYQEYIWADDMRSGLKENDTCFVNSNNFIEKIKLGSVRYKNIGLGGYYYNIDQKGKRILISD